MNWLYLQKKCSNQCGISQTPKNESCIRNERCNNTRDRLNLSGNVDEFLKESTVQHYSIKRTNLNNKVISQTMKIAIISDIHGNVPALSVVLEDITSWQPDKLIINGDVINRGPYSKKVLELLSGFHADTIYIKGNHEEFVLYAREHPVDEDQFDYHLQSFTQWTANQLAPSWLEQIQQWHESYDFKTSHPEKSVHVTHGSPLSNRDGVHKNLTDEELKNKNVHHTDIFISSHTHLPMTKTFEDTLLLNTGSVGQPLDGDARAAYGKIYLNNDKPVGEIARVAYDKKQAEKDYYESGFMEHGGPVCELIFLEHKYNDRFVGPFMRQYLSAIRAQEISVVKAVDKFISKVAISSTKTSVGKK